MDVAHSSLATGPLAPGTRLGRFEVVRWLAHGGMAELYVARAEGGEGFQKLVALKRVRSDYGGDGELVRLFKDEVRLAGMLQHPNIAQVFDAGFAEGGHYYAMELVVGEDLRALERAEAQRGRGVPLPAVLTIATSLTAALHCAHEARAPDSRFLGLVHRDVSPSNVLISYEGAVKLVDFGVAKAAGRIAQTQSGATKGKAPYLSPEQCTGAALDRRSDLYSLGVVLYELTVGARPHAADSDAVLVQQIATTDPPPPSKHDPDYPAELEAIVMRCLRREPSDRYQDALEVQRDLEAFAAAAGIVPSPLALAELLADLFPGRLAEHTERNAQALRALPSPALDEPEPTTRPIRRIGPRRRRWAVIAAATVVTASAAGIAYLATPTRARAPAIAGPGAPPAAGGGATRAEAPTPEGTSPAPAAPAATTSSGPRAAEPATGIRTEAQRRESGERTPERRGPAVRRRAAARPGRRAGEPGPRRDPASVGDAPFPR